MTAAPACACPANGSLVGNICACNIGYYYSSTTVCSACLPNCASCDLNANTCNTCADPIHMSAAPDCACPTNAVLVGNDCVCYIGHFYSSNSVCSACQNNCHTCSISSTNCLSCVDSINMPAPPSCACPTNSSLLGTICECNPGYFFSSYTICSACNSNCATCYTNQNVCDTCVDPIHMSAAPICSCPAYSTLIAGTCVCNPGYYYSTSTTCSPISQCPPQCAQCSSNNFCTACNDPENMYLNTATGTCRCWDPYASFNQTSGTCQCIQGYYMPSLGVCQMCSPPCAQCSSSATLCTECDDVDNMNLNATTGSCVCKDSNSQFNPWVKACQTNSSCNCTHCETITYNYNNITYFNITNNYN
ncbi:unnamed protein product [Blepharisma stoltei]|uniref:Uncharacterized protein n=1 Tax=Blepharisma stoltei TaxID=1481888 RepID=A0AAU9JZZ9_9CILI|nr:unnamed protein product [Blepharisma stoltei]